MIPKKIGHIWIGPKQPPTDWMSTWKERHKGWEYTLYDNDYLNSTTFRTQKQIDEYLKREAYAGVADLMRYEILYQYGGFLAAADSICFHNVDELLPRACAYTVYENEFVRGKLVSPILACEPENKFVGELIARLEKLKSEEMGSPWISTGNLFVAQMIEELKPDVIIFPSYTFIPVHYTGVCYQGDGKIYAKQMFGSTRYVYEDTKKEENNIPPNLFIRHWFNKNKKKFSEKELRKQRREIESYKKEALKAEEDRIQKMFEKSDFSKKNAYACYNC